MATGAIRIEYRSGDIRSQANKLATKYDNACDRLNGVDRKLSSMPEHSRNNYLSQSSAFLRKKTQQYDQKRGRAQTLHTRAGSFMDRARSTDQRVARHIEDNYQQFKKITGLKGSGIFGAISDFIGKISGNKWLAAAALLFGWPVAAGILAIIEVGKAIKDWYANLPDEVKYRIKFVLSIVGMAFAAAALLAVFSFASIGAAIVSLAAIVKLADSFIDVVKSGSAYAAYKRGDTELAKSLDEGTTGELFGAVMEGLGLGDAERWTFGYDIVNFAATIVSFAKIGFDIKKTMSGKGMTLGKSIAKEFKDGFFDMEKYRKGNVSLQILQIFKQNGLYSWKNIVFDVPIDDILDGAKELYDFTDDYIIPVFTDPMPETGAEWAGDIADKVPILTKFKKIFDKFPKMKPNPILRPEAAFGGGGR